MSVHAAPRSIFSRAERARVGKQRRIADEQRRVGGGEHRRAGPARAARTSGAMSNRRAHRMRVSAADVRDDVSSASVRTSRIGSRVKSATDATGPSDPMQTPGTMRSPGRSRYVIDGTMPRSMSPAASSRAHSDGTSKRRLTTIGLRVEPVHERPDVQVIDGAEPDGRAHGRASRTARCAPPASRNGGADLPLDFLARRAARAELRRVDGRDAVDVVGAVGNRDLRELRAVERPVHLNGRNRRGTSAAPPRSSARRRSRWPACRRDRGAAAARTP